VLPFIFDARRSQQFVSYEAKIFEENSMLFPVFLQETIMEVA
jgi:hypothetical protein